MTESSPPKKPAQLVGPAGLKLRTVSVSESLGRPFRIELELLSEGAFIPSPQVLGKPMGVEVDVGAEVPRYFHGLVSEFHFLGTLARLHVYRAVLRPWLWFLSRTVNCRIFQDATVVDIIKDVFSPYGFADLEPASLEGHVTKEFVVQYRESDLSFVTRLMEEEGLYYYFLHSAERHSLVLCNQHHIHQSVPKFEALPFFPPDAQRATLVPHIDRWEVANRVEANVFVSKDFDFEKPADPLLVQRSAPADHALGDLEIFEYPGEYSTFGDGEARVRLRMDEQRASAETFFGHSNARTIECGATLEVKEHPVAACNGTFLITSSVFRMAGAALESGDVALQVPSAEFVAIRSDVPFRLPRTTPKPYIMGAQTAVVVTPEGQEVDCDRFGRVRVKFHWDRRTDVPAAKSSCPVRVSQLWAGAGFGGIHVPRKGQEVLVEFLEGDPDRPIITGRVYNGANDVPYELPTHQSQSGIKTATIQGEVTNFNELRFEDAKGKEEIFIQAERDKNVRVKRSRSATIGGSDSVSVGGDRSVKVNGNLSVGIGDKGGEYTLAATSSAQLTAPQFIELKCENTVLRMTPDGFELTAGGKALLRLDANFYTQSEKGSVVMADNTVYTASSEGAQVTLDSKATIEGTDVNITGATVDVKGGMIKLNS